MSKSPKNKKDISWYNEDGELYIGHEVRTDQIYVGGPYYQGHSQIHLTIEQAKWLKKALNKAIARQNK